MATRPASVHGWRIATTSSAGKSEVREIMRPVPIPAQDPADVPDAGRWGLCDGIHRDDHEFVPA